MIRLFNRLEIVVKAPFWFFFAFLVLMEANNVDLALSTVFVFFSLLLHELGHGLTALFSGYSVLIELTGVGGITRYFNGKQISFWRRFFIIFNGPLLGSLFSLSIYFLQATMANDYVRTMLVQFFWLNLIWTGMNLLPILPLDGGQLLQLLMEHRFSNKGVCFTLLWSCFGSFLTALFFLCIKKKLAAILFLLFLFDNLHQLRLAFKRNSVSSNLIKRREEALQIGKEGDPQRAIDLLSLIRDKAVQGPFHDETTQFMAFLYSELENSSEAYALLMPMKKRLNVDGIALLHRIAFQLGDYTLVLELAAKLFISMPFIEVALRTAYAAEYLCQTKAAVGWIGAACQKGIEHLDQIVDEKPLDLVGKTSFHNFIANQIVH